MNRRLRFLLPAVLMVGMPLTAIAEEEGDSYTLQSMHEFNGTLRGMWMDLRVEQVEVLTVGRSIASSRIHRQPFRWVAGDPRRKATGDRLTYLVDPADILDSKSLPASAAEAAFDQAMSSWSRSSCLQKVDVVKRASDGSDPDIFDFAYGYGDFGDFRAADIVLGGWLPPGFFEAVVAPDSGKSVLAMSVTFIFVGPDGEPTDINNDGYLDTAANEIYFNSGFSWAAGSVAPAIDLESVALHEIGHSLGIRHFGPPPTAVMNPVYTGPKTELRPRDQASLCSIWAGWPK
jgi:hypothetical protein